MATALIGILVACSGAGPDAIAVPPKDEVTIQRIRLDEVYGPLPQHRLDLFLPSQGAGPFRPIIWIHGGGWRSGSKALDAAAFQRRAIDQGFALASVEYRPSGVARWPAPLHDVKAAVRYLRANARRLGIDSLRVGVWGAEAGGHLAALLGTTGGVSLLEGEVGTLGTSSRVQAVAAWYAPVVLKDLDFHLISIGCIPAGTVVNGLATSEVSELLGMPLSQGSTLAADASPATHVTPDDPPFLLDHGKTDCAVSYLQSVSLAAALRVAIGASGVTTTLFENVGHGGPAFTSPSNVDRVLAFFDQALR